MNAYRSRAFFGFATGAALAWSMVAATAYARTEVGVSIMLPGAVMSMPSAPVYRVAPGYGTVQTMPIYAAPEPLYNPAPPPLYSNMPRVYVVPAPVYVTPAPVYGPDAYYQPPYFAMPVPTYPDSYQTRPYRHRDRDRDGIPDRHERDNSRDGSPGHRR